MNCDEIKQLLSAYADGELNDAERRRVEGHLSGCEECRTALADHQKINTVLTSLRKVPETGNAEEVIMSEINAPGASNNRRRWLRPAIATLAVITLVTTFTGLHYSGVFTGPDDILVKARSAMENLTSFRMMDDEYIQTTENSEPYHSWHSEIDFAGDGRLYGKKYRPTESMIQPYSHELIVIDNQIYVLGNTSRPITPAQLEEIAPSKANSVRALELLSGIEELPDETIDGIECYHYRGVVDIEKWLDQGREERIDRLTWINENNEQGIVLDIDDWLQSAEDFWRTRKLTYEFWISKDDYRVRRWSGTDETPEGQPVKGGFFRATWVFDYYDFNEPITVEPPLDASGKLLDGWTTYTLEE